MTSTEGGGEMGRGAGGDMGNGGQSYDKKRENNFFFFFFSFFLTSISLHNYKKKSLSIINNKCEQIFERILNKLGIKITGIITRNLEGALPPRFSSFHCLPQAFQSVSAVLQPVPSRLISFPSISLSHDRWNN